MHAIDTEDAIGVEPARPAQGTAKYFDEASETIVPDWFLNMLQNELLGLVVEAGLTPSKTDDTQIRTAISALQKTTNNPFINYALFEDQKADGVDGGTPSTGWNVRDLQEQINNITGVSITTNVVTLPVGTYRIRGVVPGYKEGSAYDKAQSGLYNTTTSSFSFGSVKLLGNVAGGRDTNSFISEFIGEVEITATTTVDLRDYHGSPSTKGFGSASSSGEGERYSKLEIWKLD